MNYLKKDRPIPVQPEEAELTDAVEEELLLPESVVINEEKSRIIAQLVRASLSDVLYQTVVLFYFNGMTIKEIAQIMECPEGTVSYRLNSARKKIRTSVESYEGETGESLHAAVGVPLLSKVFSAEAAKVSYAAPMFTQNVGGVPSSGGAAKGFFAAHKAAVVIASVAAVGAVGATIAVASAKNKPSEDAGEVAPAYSYSQTVSDVTSDIAGGSSAPADTDDEKLPPVKMKDEPFLLDGVGYTLPCSFSELEANGWEIDDDYLSYYETTYLSSEEESDPIILKRSDGKFKDTHICIVFYNLNKGTVLSPDVSAPLSECVVSGLGLGISLEKGSDNVTMLIKDGFALDGNITEAALRERFGEPDIVDQGPFLAWWNEDISIDADYYEYDTFYATVCTDDTDKYGLFSLWANFDRT